MVALTEVTAAELIARCRRGGGAGTCALVDRYARLVHAVALRHVCRSGEVEDVAQEVFLALKAHPGRNRRRSACRAGWPRRRRAEAQRASADAAVAKEELDDPETIPNIPRPPRPRSPKPRPHPCTPRPCPPSANFSTCGSAGPALTQAALTHVCKSPLSHTADHALPG
ncbi:MAG: sigma factor [Caldilineaceae bacterium]